jgi:hypothetical protein
MRIRIPGSVPIFFHSFSYNLPTGTLSSDQKIKFFAKILCESFVMQALFQSAQHIYEKREGSGHLTKGSGPRNFRIQEAQKHADPVPDPQQCFSGLVLKIGKLAVKQTRKLKKHILLLRREENRGSGVQYRTPQRNY